MPVVSGSSGDDAGGPTEAMVQGGDEAGPGCSTDGNALVGSSSEEDGMNMPPPPPLQQGYKRMQSGDESPETSDTSISSLSSASANSSISESEISADHASDSFAGASTSSNSFMPEASSSMIESATGEEKNPSTSESSMSSYTDCTTSSNSSSGEDREGKSSNSGSANDEDAVDARRLFPQERGSTSESDGSVVDASLTFTTSSSSSESESLLEYINSRSSSSNMQTSSTISNNPISPVVAVENRKNIFKTLQGQGDIITNWSLLRTTSGGISWMLLNGRPQDAIAKIHPRARRMTTAAASTSTSSLSTPRSSISGAGTLAARLRASEISLQNDLDMIHNAINRIKNRVNNASAALSATPSTSLRIEDCMNVAVAKKADDGKKKPEVEADRKKPEAGPSTSTASPNKGDVDGSAASGAAAAAVAKPKIRLYPCPRCDEDPILISDRVWFKHMIKSHGREERAQNRDTLYDCASCNKQFGLKWSRDAHQKTHKFPLK